MDNTNEELLEAIDELQEVVNQDNYIETPFGYQVDARAEMLRRKTIAQLSKRILDLMNANEQETEEDDY